MILDDLQALGLSEKEAITYLTLHEYGASAVSTLARRTGIKRTSLYDVINALFERGLISSFEQGGAKYYIIDDVNKLLIQQKQRVVIGEKLVTELNKRPTFDENVYVHYYKGIEGYRQIYRDILTHKPSELLVWLDMESFFEGLDMDEEEQWTQQRVEKKIPARIITPKSPTSVSFHNEDSHRNRETRFLPDTYPIRSNMFVFDYHIIYLHFGKEPLGIRIQNNHLYQMQKSIFNLNWDSLDR